LDQIQLTEQFVSKKELFSQNIKTYFGYLVKCFNSNMTIKDAFQPVYTNFKLYPN